MKEVFIITRTHISGQPTSAEFCTQHLSGQNKLDGVTGYYGARRFDDYAEALQAIKDHLNTGLTDTYTYQINKYLDNIGN